MPIYQGTSTKNKSEIVINGVQMQKVYVGDRLVWVKPSGIYPVNYGLLYNGHCYSAPSPIYPVGWHIATRQEYLDVNTFFGGISVSGNFIKEPSLDYWSGIGASWTNSGGLNLRGAGIRGSGGSFGSIKQVAFFRTGTTFGIYHYHSRASASSANGFEDYGLAGKDYGEVCILVKDSTILQNGEVGQMTGNDGKVYRTICINDKEFIADALTETRFRDGSIIPWYGADAANFFTNAEWAALTTAGCCAYDNTLSNVATGFTFPT